MDIFEFLSAINYSEIFTNAKRRVGDLCDCVVEILKIEKNKKDKRIVLRLRITSGGGYFDEASIINTVNNIIEEKDVFCGKFDNVIDYRRHTTYSHTWVATSGVECTLDGKFELKGF